MIYDEKVYVLCIIAIVIFLLYFKTAKTVPVITNKTLIPIDDTPKSDFKPSNFIIPGTLGMATQGCNNMFFYGSMNKGFKKGKVTARITSNGTTTRTKAYKSHGVTMKKSYTGMEFEAYFHVFNLKRGDIIDIEGYIVADDDTVQYITKVFRLDDEMCDTVANKHDLHIIA